METEVEVYETTMYCLEDGTLIFETEEEGVFVDEEGATYEIVTIQ